MSSTERARQGLGRLIAGIVQNHELNRASSAGAWRLIVGIVQNHELNRASSAGAWAPIGAQAPKNAQNKHAWGASFFVRHLSKLLPTIRIKQRFLSMML
jgi:hypothetical protein